MSKKDAPGDHYETKFEFPLWKMIREHAVAKDISYLQASKEILPEYQKGIRYRDDEYELSQITAREEEWREMAKLQD